MSKSRKKGDHHKGLGTKQKSLFSPDIIGSLPKTSNVLRMLLGYLVKITNKSKNIHYAGKPT